MMPPPLRTSALALRPSDPPSGARPRPAASAPLTALAADLLRPNRRPRLRAGPCDAEDLLQDALLLFVERHERIPPGSWRAWILGTLYNRERELWKKRALWRKLEPLLEAHVQHDGPSYVEPDAALRQRQVLCALVWLLEQVDPSRRDVAERYLFDGVTLAVIAAETGIPLGTVRSQWDRAKADMRAALARERARLDDVFVAVMLAILGAFALWIDAHVRRAAAALAAPFEPVHRPPTRGSPAAPRARPSSPRAARERHAATSDRRRSRAGAAFACAVLPLWVLRHTTSEALDPPVVAIAHASFEAAAGIIAGRAQPDGDTVRQSDPVVPAHVPTTNVNQQHGTTPGDDPRMPAPILTTIVDRPREGGSQPAMPRATRTTATATPTAGRSVDAAPAAGTEREVGRALLDRANTALRQGHEDIARDALRLYDDDFSDNPFPALRAQVASGLAARKKP